jgi:hypothetical protein
MKCCLYRYTAANPTRTNPIPVVIEWAEVVTPDITLADLEVSGVGTVGLYKLNPS